MNKNFQIQFVNFPGFPELPGAEPRFLAESGFLSGAGFLYPALEY